jgi:hypothetical protein
MHAYEEDAGALEASQRVELNRYGRDVNLAEACEDTLIGSRVVLPRNCSVMCQDSGDDQRRPSSLRRRRAMVLVSSSVTASGSGIATKRRIAMRC